MSNKKTFIILTPGFPESEADTTCLPMQQYFVRALKERQPDLNIVVLTFQYPYHQNPYKWFDIAVIPFGGRNKGGLPKLRLRRKIYSTLKKIYTTNKIVGLFSFWYNECAFTGKRFGDKYDIRHYCWILGQDAKKGNKYPHRIPPREDELIALSDFLQNEFEKNHGVRPRFVVPPGVDERSFDPLDKEKDIELLGVGSLIPLKQYEIFIEVIAEIKNQMPGVKAMIAGKGPERERLESLINKLELQNNVTLVGELPYPEVLQLMQRSKLLLHPSSYEGFGCVCVEALYAGAHVISFCKPMNIDIPHWHIVKNKEEMFIEALKLLKDGRTEYKTISPYLISDAVKKVISLFKKELIV
jgi:glycosyltransferase involved in cell wall biosynthesis